MPDFLKHLGMDRYDRQARLAPALISLAPAGLLIAVWNPKAWASLSGLAAFMVGMGLLYFLASLTRYFGRGVQTRMELEDGRMTTVVLRHRNPHIHAETKARYHTVLRQNGFRVPTADEEEADPAMADGCYRAASDWLINSMRDPEANKLLLNDNINYGFRRNLLGIKPLAIGILAASLIADCYLLASQRTFDPIWWAGFAVGLGMTAAFLVWALVVTPAFVQEASLAYALRFHAEAERVAR